MRAADGAVIMVGSGPCCTVGDAGFLCMPRDTVVQRTQVNINEEVVIVREYHCGLTSCLCCLFVPFLGYVCFTKADERYVRYTRRMEPQSTGVLTARVYKVELPGYVHKPQVTAPPPVAPMSAAPVTQNPLAAAPQAAAAPAVAAPSQAAAPAAAPAAAA